MNFKVNHITLIILVLSSTPKITRAAITAEDLAVCEQYTGLNGQSLRRAFYVNVIDRHIGYTVPDAIANIALITSKISSNTEPAALANNSIARTREQRRINAINRKNSKLARETINFNNFNNCLMDIRGHTKGSVDAWSMALLQPFRWHESLLFPEPNTRLTSEIKINFLEKRGCLSDYIKQMDFSAHTLDELRDAQFVNQVIHSCE